MIIRNMLNYRDHAESGIYVDDERYTMPSMTVPDQALSINDILLRHSRGLNLPQRIAEWDEDDDMPDLRTLDLSERQELAQQYNSELRAIQARYNRVVESTGLYAGNAPEVKDEPKKAQGVDIDAPDSTNP